MPYLEVWFSFKSLFCSETGRSTGQKGRSISNTVCDAGCISYYLKSFPTAGVDGFVETDGMYVGIDMDSDITLGKVFFVKHGSVQIGSYVYDEPGNANDPRLVNYGDVPAIAFSEAMGDLVKIAGKSEGQQPEAADV